MSKDIYLQIENLLQLSKDACVSIYQNYQYLKEYNDEKDRLYKLKATASKKLNGAMYYNGVYDAKSDYEYECRMLNPVIEHLQRNKNQTTNNFNTFVENNKENVLSFEENIKALKKAVRINNKKIQAEMVYVDNPSALDEYYQDLSTIKEFLDLKKTSTLEPKLLTEFKIKPLEKFKKDNNLINKSPKEIINFAKEKSAEKLEEQIEISKELDELEFIIDNEHENAYTDLGNLSPKLIETRKEYDAKYDDYINLQKEVCDLQNIIRDCKKELDKIKEDNFENKEGEQLSLF